MIEPPASQRAARQKPNYLPWPSTSSVTDWLKAHPNTIRVTAVIAFFAFWELAARDMNSLFMSYPSAIFRAAWTITESGELPQAFVTSMEPFLLGLAISIIGGVVIGVLIAQFWFLEYTLDPFINALYAVPRIALLPLIMLWAGLDVTGKVAIIVSIAIFPVIINTYSGIKDVRGSLIEIGRAYCASEWQIFAKIILPAAVPYIMAGIRLAVGLAIIGMIVAEFFTSVTGLGGLIVLYANSFATAKLFVMIIVVGVLGAVLSELVIYIERRLSRWRVSERERY
jgi:ABC-type nitrate/sulfonate/bicarbonate transport system permease component